MSAIAGEEVTKIAEALDDLSSAVTHLEQVHSHLLKQNAKVCWYMKTSKERQEVLRRRLEEMSRKSVNQRELC